jgi:hypothetical protein
VKYPAPTYVVAGVVTDAEDGSALEGVAVSGAVTATTDATGFFTSGVKSEPINGVITFTKTGYATVNRAVAMAAVTTGTVSESLVVAMGSGTASLPEGITVLPEDPTQAPVPVVEEEVTVSADKLAEMGVPFVNETSEPIDVLVPAKSFDLPYGAMLAPVKSEAHALEALTLWGLANYGNDPTVGFVTYTGMLAMRLFPGVKVKNWIVTPLTRLFVFIFVDSTDGTTSSFDIDIIDSYNSVVDPVVDPHDPHNPHDNGNGGGGETSGV